MHVYICIYVGEESRGGWEAAGRKTHVALYACLVHDLVQLVGGDAGADGGGGDVEDLAGEAADLTHGILGLDVEQLDLVAVDERAAGLGDAVGGVVGVRDGLGDGAALGQGVYRPQGPREGELGEGVVDARLWIRVRHWLGREEAVEYTVFLLVEALMRGLGEEDGQRSLVGTDIEGRMLVTDPVSLEAILGAEVAVLDAQLEAGRALQRAGVVLAVGAQALPLGRRFVGHRRGSHGAFEDEEEALAKARWEGHRSR